MLSRLALAFENRETGKETLKEFSKETFIYTEQDPRKSSKL
jgi:hypothetical protein